MLRRSLLQPSFRRFLRRIPRQISSERPLNYSLGKQFSTDTPPNASPRPSSAGSPPESGSSFPKLAFGGVAVGAAIMLAYKAGYLDEIVGKEHQKVLEEAKVGDDNRDEKDVKINGEQLVLPNSKEHRKLSSDADGEAQKVESKSNVPQFEAPTEEEGVNQSRVKDKSDITVTQDVSNAKNQDSTVSAPEKEFPEASQESISSADQKTDYEISSKGSDHVGHPEETASPVVGEEVQAASISLQDDVTPKEDKIKESTVEYQNIEGGKEGSSANKKEPQKSLLDEYYLGGTAAASSNREHPDKYENLSDEEAFATALEELKDGYMSKDGKLIFDFLQAIHAAEERQAELDARTFAEEKRAIKEKYEKELKDAIAREFMRAEEAALLDKELKRERAKAAAAIKALQEKAEEKLKMELEQKEQEAEFKLKKVEELTKAELAAAIAREKAAQIEKIAEANLHINALCMAFFARSEEARQSHSVHKLALGALALEDALSKGLPIQKELEKLHPYLKGTDKDSVLELVLSSLPTETRNCGTDTLLQLNQKFNELKSTLRHFSLIPPGGGGIMAHSIAEIASWLRVKESDQSGDGIESVITKVEGYLAEGKLAEAADVLEGGVKGSQAAEVAYDWVKRARNRAVTEQALTFLQAYVTTLSLT